MADIQSLGKLSADERKLLEDLEGAVSLVINASQPQWLLDQDGQRVRNPGFAGLVPVDEGFKAERILDLREHKRRKTEEQATGNGA